MFRPVSRSFSGLHSRLSHRCWMHIGIPICLLTYLPTYCIVQSPSWQANWFAASQEIPRNSRNPKLHYRTHKRPPPVPILGQLNPAHIHTSHLLEIHPNIIHPSMPRSPQWTLALRFLYRWKHLAWQATDLKEGITFPQDNQGAIGTVWIVKCQTMI